MKVKHYFEDPNLRSIEQIHEIQEKRLVPQLRYCYDHSSFYRRKFEEVGVWTGRCENHRRSEDASNFYE